ncbi:MAG: NAD(P)H oxidoreductase [Pseudomonadota bacterium]
MDSLLVFAHPRRNSLTGRIVDIFENALTASGHNVEIADLYSEGFDPRLGSADEPDWDDSKKIYSPEVQAEMARVERNEATVLVFPVFWWSMPALLKGWIDRVWNNGWAYGDAKYPHRHVWMIAIAGNEHPSYVKRGYDTAMKTQLKVGILDYCGVQEPRLEILCGSIEGQEYVDQILRDATRLGGEYKDTITNAREK